MKKVLSSVSGSIKVQVEIEDRVCALYSIDSAIGKTFLCNILKKDIYSDWHDEFRYIDYTNYSSLRDIVSSVNPDKNLIIVCDNADEFPDACRDAILNTECTFIVIGRYLSKIVAGSEFGYYELTHDDSSKTYLVRRKSI